MEAGSIMLHLIEQHLLPLTNPNSTVKGPWPGFLPARQ